MNQYDPTKDNDTNQDHANDSASTDKQEHVEQADPYTAADSGYTYPPAGDGQQYTNPDGSHGFIYNSAEAPKDTERRYRGAVIALSSVLATVVVGAGCLIGAYFVTKSLNSDDAPPSASDTRGDVMTSDGLVIDDDDEDQDDSRDTAQNEESKAESDTSAIDGSGTAFSPDNTDTEQNAGSNSSTNSSTERDPAPVIESIQKLPPNRTDTDGDGKAEIETNEQGEVLTSAGANPLSVATVVHRVAASVVEITTETIVQSGYVGQYISSGAGSGVVISDEGYVVTNNHVIDGANTITVRMNDGTEFPATLVGTDAQTDVAVLRIEPGDYALTVATLGSSFDLVVGEDILAIGNPLGSLGGTVTEGMISATARDISVNGVNMTLLQVSAPINPGNSGGGLFNLAGELVGVVNAKMSSEEIEGLGFAIPIDTAYEIILELIEFGYVRGRPALDFNVVDRSSFFETYVCVYDNTHSVVQYNDIILAADNIRVASVSDLEAIVRTKQVGDTLELIIQRNNRQMTVTVTLVEKRPQRQ